MDSNSLFPQLPDEFTWSKAVESYDWTLAKARDMSFIRPHEYVWRDIQPLLQDRGYMLRPRYHKDHKLAHRPFLNRVKTCLLPCFYFPEFMFEDHIASIQPHVLDACRMSDNMPVMLKVLDGPLQYGDLDFLKLLSTPEAKNNPKNHCVPLLDVLTLSKNIIIIVLPILKPWQWPPFEKVGQVLDFVLQIAETLDFLHEHNIAHGDLYSNNIMMDGSPFHPQQFHPMSYWRTPDGRGFAPTFSRSQVPRVQYYIIDFGNSIMFPSFEHRRPLRARVGADHSAPELAAYPGEVEPWDVFKLDIYTFGNFIRTRLIQKYSNLDFLEPLVDCMTAKDPQARPDARRVADAIRDMCTNSDPTFLHEFSIAYEAYWYGVYGLPIPGTETWKLQLSTIDKA